MVEPRFISHIDRAGSCVNSPFIPGQRTMGEEILPSRKVKPSGASFGLIDQADVSRTEDPVPSSLVGGPGKVVTELPEKPDGSVPRRHHAHTIVVCAPETMTDGANVIVCIGNQSADIRAPLPARQLRAPDRTAAYSPHPDFLLESNNSPALSLMIDARDDVTAVPLGKLLIQLPVQPVGGVSCEVSSPPGLPVRRGVCR